MPHPFDKNKHTPVITGNRSDWIQFVADNYLSEGIKGNTVLEIASNNGDIASEIMNQSPKNFCMIDCDPRATKITGADLILDDAITWLSKAPKFDVVICFGFLYHIHHGLHFLELIVNHCQPKKIILDCVIAPFPFEFLREEVNQAGNRWVNPGWKHAPFNLNIPFHVYNESFNAMGYHLHQNHLLAMDDFSKSNSWIAEWRTSQWD